MANKKKLLGICGSASQHSSNLSILKSLAEFGASDFELTILDNLADLPHFRTERTDKNVPEVIVEFRESIANADGIIVCTPEYVFSIPSGLKNAIEWCVSTTVFSDKPIGIITASAHGVKGHEELKMIMETIQTTFVNDTTLLIQGVKGKVNKEGKILDGNTENELKKFMQSFKTLVDKTADHRQNR